MATGLSKTDLPHIVRTAADSRQAELHKVYLHDVKEVNDTVKLIILRTPYEEPSILHQPGQWLDVHIPGVEEVGGFTISSPPSTAILAPLNTHPYLELAIQKSSNAPAAFFWQPKSSIRGTELQVRVGGSFIWPPPKLSIEEVATVKRVVFIAGGIGINPLMSMLTYISEKEKWPPLVRVFYSVRVPSATSQNSQNQSNQENENLDGLSYMLFFDRLNNLVRDARIWEVDFKFRLIVTGSGPENSTQTIDESGEASKSLEPNILADISYGSRLQWSEIQDAIGKKEQRKDALVYICGPPAMTDEIVGDLKEKAEMEERRVLCEKWW